MRAILTYHSIDTSGSPISVHPDAFARHLDWLSSGRVQVTSIAGLLNLPPEADAVAITFDDAFENFLEVAPALAARRLAATVFVVSDRAGATNAWEQPPAPGIPVMPLLGWPALVRLQEQGIVIGAHGRTHRALTGLDQTAVEDEVRGSADAIARATGRRPDVFAYPYGRFDEAVARAVAADFRYACTTEFRTIEASSRRERLPRLDMYYMHDPARLESWGTARFRRFVNVRHQLRRVKQALVGVHRPQARSSQARVHHD